MKNNRNDRFDELSTLLDNQKIGALREALSQLNGVDAAGVLERLSPEQAALAFRTLPKELAAEAFANLPPEAQQVIVTALTDRELAAVVSELYVDDVVDMLEEMPASAVKRVLKNTRPETRGLINQFLRYPDNSVGSIMTAEFIDLKREMTVSEAIRHIRDVGEKRELIYTCYVVDDQRKLEGVVTLKELLLSPDSRTVGELMEAGVISALTTDDREEAARRLQRYDFLALPVTDREGRLVGIVTVDDVMDVMEAEATEDFERMAAMAPSEKPYLKTGAFTLARKRILWLLVLMISGMITGGILGRYEAAFAALPMLVTFIPMLTDTGGNAGSQSSTLIIRGMAVGEIRARDLPRVLWKELRVSLIVGVALSAVNYARLLLTYPGQAGMALTVALAMLATVVMAKTIGGMLPILAKALHADPAIMAAPLITTIVDALSLLIYFSLAQMLLGI